MQDAMLQLFFCTCRWRNPYNRHLSWCGARPLWDSWKTTDDHPRILQYLLGV